MQLLAATLNSAFVGKLPEHRLEACAIRILQAEGARKLAGANFALLRRDEGEQVVFGGEARSGFAARRGQ